MPRVKRGVTARARHKKVLKQTKGFIGRSKNCFRLALGRLEKGMQHAYRDRRGKKRVFRSLWIQRINAAARERGMKYSTLMGKIISQGITLNRKMLSEIAIHDKEAFDALLSSLK